MKQKMLEETLSDKVLRKEFINETLVKIQKVLNLVLQYYDVHMTYDIEARNKIFCEVIKKTKTELTSTEMFQKIIEVVTTTDNIGPDDSEWLSEQIYKFHNDIFLLHYFYAALYSYNYDIQIRERIKEEHVKKFCLKANEIYKKYKDLSKSESENT